MSDAPTPIVDAIKEWHDCTNKKCGEYVFVDFARKLERELAEAKAEVARLGRRDSFDLQGINRVMADQTKTLTMQLAEAQADRARLKWLLANFRWSGASYGSNNGSSILAGVWLKHPSPDAIRYIVPIPSDDIIQAIDAAMQPKGAATEGKP